MIDIATTSREPTTIAVDDAVVPFQVQALDVRGRTVRLGAALDDILTRHDYPAAVSKLLGEAIALTVLLGSALKFEGRFILQTKTDGPVRMIVVDYRTPGLVRAYAQFDAEAVAAVAASGAPSTDGTLLGHGHLAMTIDQGADMSRYQGLVALSGGSLEEVAHEYFLRSEQIPTRVRLAVGEEFSQGPDGARRRWRAGGMLLQFLPTAAERMRVPDLDPGDAPEGTAPHVIDEDDAWVEGRALVETVEDLELLDPDLSTERLLFRLFHEHGVRVFETAKVEAKCSCSRDRVGSILASFSPEERDGMVENGAISVTCEFCNAKYAFRAEEIVDQAAQGEPDDRPLN
jgi:molecular chaperone Hsp33